jgi:demethylmenaquinone methyltransferase / 2-methoxy-6-polyprenyl-1,4-benzoquinol methylase
MPHSSPPDSKTIQQMFDELAPRYDLFNRLTSMGMDKKWREYTLEPIRTGMRVLDLGCGTGDLSIAAAKKLEGKGEVLGLDFSENMLRYAEKRRRKLDLAASKSLRFVLRRAEDLPLEKEPYDLIVSGFVLRNLYKNIDAILKGVFQSLREGGEISFLDITEPKQPILKTLWKFYMTSVVALYGKILFGKAYPMFYLTQSAERFLKAAEFIEKLKSFGFEQIRTRSFMLGIITLYRAEKPRIRTA